MRSAPPQHSFSAGETSPLLYGRPDYQRHQQGAAQMRGFLPLRQGGATRAPGTFYLGETQSDLQARLIPFEFAEDDAAVLEFTTAGMRVWRYGVLVMDGGSPYSMAHGMTLAEIKAMQWAQAADVIYLATGERPIRTLSRFALDDWRIEDADFSLGPFMPDNIDDNIVITADDETGSVTLTATADVFEVDHVGGLFYLKEVDTDVPVWVGNQAYDNAERVSNDGRVYRSTNNDDTDAGPNPPLHSAGSVRSGKGTIKWAYVSSDFGVVEITAVASATSATATVRRRLPPGIVSDGTARWAEGAWSAKNGYPAALVIHDQRFYAAATPSSPRTIWASALGGFLDMEPTDLPDGAFAYDIAGSVGRNRIMWLTSTDKGLAIGALGEEYVAASSVRSETIAVDNIRITPESTIGSANARPIAPRGAPIFISRDRKRVFEMRYDLTQEKRRPVELSLPSEHLGADAFQDVVWQSSPSQMAWITRASGELAVMVSDPDEDVLGWAPMPVAEGAVLSLCVTPSSDGSRDVVTGVVKRTIGGSEQIFVEEFDDVFAVLSGAQPLVDVCHLYAAVVFSPGSPTNIITGLDHLNGEAVCVWTPEGNLDSYVVAAGQVETAFDISAAIVGLFDDSHILRTHDIQQFAPEGSSLGRQKSVRGFAARVHRTAALSSRTIVRDEGEVIVTPPFQDMIRSEIGVREVGGLSGVLRSESNSGDGSEVQVEFRPIGGAPATVLALTPLADVKDG